MLWRISRRTPPAGFIQPCQPTIVAAPPAGPGWLHEVKHDGYRILARKQGERVEVWSRRGADFTDRFPKIAEAVRKLPAESALIDGEAVAFRPDGLPPCAPRRAASRPHLSPSTFSAPGRRS
jgi:bifunctional non-homologous end joining protein LigD